MKYSTVTLAVNAPNDIIVFQITKCRRLVREAEEQELKAVRVWKDVRSKRCFFGLSFLFFLIPLCTWVCFFGKCHCSNVQIIKTLNNIRPTSDHCVTLLLPFLFAHSLVLLFLCAQPVSELSTKMVFQVNIEQRSTKSITKIQMCNSHCIFSLHFT